MSTNFVKMMYNFFRCLFYKALPGVVVAISLSQCRPLTYDLIIRNGTLYIGDGGAPIAADLAVMEDKIVKIGAGIRGQARQEIDATGLAVSPGFIDLHTHLEPLPFDPEAQSHIRQGVTTALGGPDGSCPWPLGVHMDTLQQMGIGYNVAFLVGHNTARAHVMGIVNREPTASELDSMKAFILQGMLDGAFGISTGLKYLPGTYSKTHEVIEVSKVAAQLGGFYTSHLREEGLGLLQGVAEAITIAEQANIPVVLTHHKAIGKAMWGSSTKTLAMVDSARAKGLDVMIDQYPYTASHTGISILIPAWALEGKPYEAFAQRCENPELRDSIKAGIVFNIVNDRGGDDLHNIQFARFNWKPELEGKTLYDWALLEGLEPTPENGAELVIQAQLHRGANCIFHAIDEQDVRRIMQHPFTMIASDGRLSQPGKGHPHPRAYGTFPRVLGHYVREEKILSLEQAIYKMTGLPAMRMGLKDRGLLKQDYFADIVIFDPNTVIDKATFESPHQYPYGIPYVIINGALTVDKGAYVDKRAGKVLRGPGYKGK